MTEQPELYNLTNSNLHFGGDALKFIDTPIQSHVNALPKIVLLSSWVDYDFKPQQLKPLEWLHS